MDAIQTENLSPEGFWRAYVGEASPLTFMNRLHSPDPREAATEYVLKLPHLWGIVRRYTWKASFEAPWQFRKEEIIAALAAHLEATEAEWLPRLDQSAPDEPAPVPAYEAPTPTATEPAPTEAWTSDAPTPDDAPPAVDEAPVHDVAVDDAPQAEASGDGEPA